MAETKFCFRCKTEKDPGLFYRNKNTRDGLYAWCKQCCNESRRGTCSDCGGDINSRYRKTGKCIPCFNGGRRGEDHPNWKGGRHVDKNGYVALSGHQGHPNANAGGQIFEHILVMSEHLGRPLLPGENVHHKNGVRDDNRIENLELWSTKQPPGQRVVDKVAWAREILAQYEPELDKLED